MSSFLESVVRRWSLVSTIGWLRPFGSAQGRRGGCLYLRLVGWRLLRGRRRRRFLCRGCRLRRRGHALANDLDMNNLHWTKGFVIAGVGGHVGNLFYQSDAGLVALAEDGVIAVEVRHGHLRDKKLRSVSVWAGVGIGEAAGLVEQ